MPKRQRSMLLLAAYVVSSSCAFQFRSSSHLLVLTSQRSSSKLTSSKDSTVEVGEWVGWDSSKHAAFLEHYWQRRPLLVRGAFPDMADRPAVTPDELCSFACDDSFAGWSSRIVKESDRSVQWGPFSEAEMNALKAPVLTPKTLQKKRRRGLGPSSSSRKHADDDEVNSTAPKAGWALLINDLERWVPSVHAVAEAFSFVPTWRHDDVMVSWAPFAGSGIGAHVDSYDVFLVQGSGTRDWEVMARTLDSDQEIASLIGGGYLDPGLVGEGQQALSSPLSGLRVLEEGAFEGTHKWSLQPGDMLYLPPRVPHRGRSTSKECTTISVGFRLPSVRDMVLSFAGFITSEEGSGTAKHREAAAAAGGEEKRNERPLVAASGALLDINDLTTISNERSSSSSSPRGRPDGSSSGAGGGSGESGGAVSSSSSKGFIDGLTVREAKRTLRAALLEVLSDDAGAEKDALFANWFGRLATTPQRFDPSVYAEGEGEEEGEEEEEEEEKGEFGFYATTGEDCDDDDDDWRLQGGDEEEDEEEEEEEVTGKEGEQAAFEEEEGGGGQALAPKKETDRSSAERFVETREDVPESSTRSGLGGEGEVLRRVLGSKFAFVLRGSNRAESEQRIEGGGTLFADGYSFSFGTSALPFVLELCDRGKHQSPLAAPLDPQSAEGGGATAHLIEMLLEDGFLSLD